MNSGNEAAVSRSQLANVLPIPIISSRTLEPNPIPDGREACDYGEMVRRNFWALNQPMVTLASKVGLTRGCVLDIGSGPGWIPIELALRHPGWKIWAIDASESMVDHAREAAARWGVTDRIHFVRGNAEDIPFIKGMFDVVYSNFTLHHLPIPEVMLNEAARVVRGGGRVIIRDLLRQPAWKIPILMTFSKYVLHCNEEQLRMYEESLAAALSVKEVRLVAQRSSLSMADVRTTQGLYVTITT